MRKFNLKILLICLFIVFIVAFIGSLFTSNNVNSKWYESVKPSITPPNYVFPIAWTILFFLIALSLYFALINSKTKDNNQRKIIVFVFGINFILNILWTFFYFNMHNPLLAFYNIILLIISILSLIFVCWKINKISAYLLLPYLLWVCFASVLNWLSIK